MTDLPAARILVIDDDAEIVDILAAVLRAEGYHVLCALTAEDGLRLFILSRPDLVSLDIRVSDGMSGAAVLKRIRATNPAARVVMVTANTDPELACEALELGVVAYIDKPFDFAYLKRVIAMALQDGHPAGAD